MEIIRSMALMSMVALISCDCKDAIETNVLLEVDKTVVKVGETVTFSVKHNANYLSIYTGDASHDYFTSASFILQGKNNEDLQNEVFRPTNPNIKPYVCSLADTPIGAVSVKDNLLDYRSLDGDGLSLINNPVLTDNRAEIVFDDSIKNSAFKVSHLYPQYWSHGLRFNVNTGVGENTKLTIRMRFAKNYLTSPDTGKPNSAVTTFTSLVSLGGIAQGESTVQYKDPWSTVEWGPSLTYLDYTVDLAATIDAWETLVGKKMETLSYIQLRFVAMNDAGYVGDFFIESAKYGGTEYFPFSVGKSLPVIDNSGLNTFKYTYKKSGTYNAIIIGNNVGTKKYSGDGYQDNKVDVIGADEYNYNSQLSSVKIVVEP